MTLEEMVTKLRERAHELAAERSKRADEITEIRAAYTSEDRDPTDDEASKLRSAVEARDSLDEQIDDATKRADELQKEIDGNAAARELAAKHSQQEKRHSPARVTSEERTYTAESSRRGVSFFSDAFRMRDSGDPNARERLERHAREVQVEGELTARAADTGSFAGLVVPQYLVDDAAIIARAGRKFANFCNRQQLPAEGMSLVIPKGTTGATTAVQATQNSSVSNTDEVWTNVTVPVVTIAGQQDVSRQTLERGTPGIDAIVYADIAADYAVRLDTQVLSGSGSSGQMLGVLNTSNTNQATAFTAAVTAPALYTKTAGQINAVETSRFLPPDLIVMHSRRWNWLISQVDGQNRPYVVPGSHGPMNAMGIANGEELEVDGSFVTLPVISDPNVPVSVGTGPEDQVLVVRRADLLLWEDGDGMPRQLRFEQTLGDQLTVKLVGYNYSAFSAGRYPTAVGVVGGNAGTAGDGLIAPTF